jgi:iron complex outermembrane receptor protein
MGAYNNIIVKNVTIMFLLVSKKMYNERSGRLCDGKYINRNQEGCDFTRGWIRKGYLMSLSRLSMLRKALLASAVSVVTFAGGAVQAQETTNDDGPAFDNGIEVVTVVGVRGSLLRSMDLKAKADTILDAISSEELGKFPDRNVADALGNIPGVTVSRGAGAEGQTVTIRGLGEEFTTTTLNGRILPTDSSSRAFAFDVLPSEMISGAEVRKAVDASQLDGSLGGAIDLRSARPFDNKGLHLSGSLEGEYDDLPGQMGYKAAGVFSDTFNGDRMGLLLSLSYSRRHVRTDNLHEYTPSQVTEADDNVDYNGDGIIGSDVSYIRPDYYSPGVLLAKFQRLGLSGSFQYQPNDKVLITLDALYSYYDATTTNYAESNFLAPREDSSDPNGEEKWDLSTVTIDKNNVITGFSMHDLVAEVLVD